MNEQQFLRLISSPPNSIGDRLLLSGLRAASWGYALAMRLRNLSFDAGLRSIHDVGVPVISVGNLTTGGTGKTPVVAWLAEQMQSLGRTPGIVSRGYRAFEGGINDEWKVLNLLSPGTLHLQNRDRVAAARDMLRRLIDLPADDPTPRVNVIIADDAFQHRRLARALDIVLIDALNPFGFGSLLPRGLLREPLSCLRRAGLVVMTRADLVNTARREELWRVIHQHQPRTPRIETAFVPDGVINLKGGRDHAPSSSPVFGFCGIGNPVGFQQTLMQAGMEPAGFRAFPDHHHYSASEMQELQRAAANAGCSRLITTLKDLVKLGTLACELPISALSIRTNVLAGHDELLTALQRVSAIDAVRK